MTLKKCYNKACGQEYAEDQNSDNACRHHPGAPVFHEGLKGWSCCKKRTHDFSEFLNMPGCTLGTHNPNKQEPEQAPKAKPPPPPPAPMPAPIPAPTDTTAEEDANTPPVRVLLEHTPAARTALQNARARHAEELAKRANAATEEVAVGTRCVNKGCTGEYAGPATADETCMCHSGEPVFHEGMKYWSCCQRRTTDFQTFLNQTGCTAGKHKWHPDDHLAPKQVKCRYDYFQGAESISMNIYAKNIDPEASFLEIAPRKLVCHLTFDNNKTFDLDMPLRGAVVPSQCSARVLGTKLEITLRKATADNWAQLEG